MYWLRYSQMKKETAKKSLGEMIERFKELSSEVLAVWREIPSDLYDTPFYEYMCSDMEFTFDCYVICLEEKGQEQELNYYCKRVLK